MRVSLCLMVFALFLGVTPVHAQDELPPPVITAENVARLGSVRQWHYKDGFHEIVRPSVNPEEQNEGPGSLHTAKFESGWFEMDANASRFVIVTAAQDLWVINDTGEWIFSIDAPINTDGMRARLVDAAFAPHSIGLPLIATYSDGETAHIRLEDGQVYGNPFLQIQLYSAGMPVSQWIDCPGETYYECVAWLEMVGVDGVTTSLVRMPAQAELWSRLAGDSYVIEFDDLSGFENTPYAPADDPDALVRIGRIEPPYVVTSSPDGLVKLWDLQTGSVLAEVQVENSPVVFGQLNANETHLAWRGPYSETLNLLDFQTGENQVVTDLSGAYAQFFLVSHDADVIFTVHVDDEPVVVAWDVATGQRYDLGPFRDCGREPDMARLSADGTTLVIGCDTGLDIWQVTADS